MKPETEIVRFDAAPGDPHRPTSPPLYQTATFAFESATHCGPYDYSRSGNPTRALLEAQLAKLEGASRAFAYSTGMAALTAVCRLLRPGDRIVAGDDLYGGTWRLLSRVVAPQGIEVAYADPTDPGAFAEVLDARTKLVLLETPTNPRLAIAPIEAIAEAAHRVGARLAVDNSLLSPYLQRPLDLGADLVVHSATKCLSGHGDLVAGLVATRDAELAERLAFLHNAEGAVLGPFDSWLLLRGMKTLAVRLDRAQYNAGLLADWLQRRPEITGVYWPGLPDHPGSALNARQARGPGAVVSFTTGDPDLSRRVVDALELFTIAVSFGNVASAASLPCWGSHAAIPAHVRAARALPEDLVRLSVGIEDAGDLLEDLARAFRHAGIRAA